MANAGQASGSNKPAIYESTPPEWLPKLSNSGDLGKQKVLVAPSSFNTIIGYQGFFPPNPTLEEDAFSEYNVKNGQQNKSIIPVGVVPMHVYIY